VQAVRSPDLEGVRTACGAGAGWGGRRGPVSVRRPVRHGRCGRDGRGAVEAPVVGAL